jgi:hypothetical protein
LILLSNNQIERIAYFVEDSDYYVRRDARDRLKGLDTAEAHVHLEHYSAELAAFRDRAVSALKQAGLLSMEHPPTSRS